MARNNRDAPGKRFEWDGRPLNALLHLEDHLLKDSPIMDLVGPCGERIYAYHAQIWDNIASAPGSVVRKLKRTFHGKGGEQVFGAGTIADRSFIEVDSDGNPHSWARFGPPRIESFRIPLVIRDPSPAAVSSRGRIVDRFTETIDVMPTILAWLGMAVPHACDGRSLSPFLAWRNASRLAHRSALRIRLPYLIRQCASKRPEFAC